MDNSQLWQAYNSANAKMNVFDRILALQEFDKEYKKTDFYKQTKMSVKELQQYCIMFRINDILDNVVTYASTEGIAQFIEEILDAIDEDTIQSFFDRIANNLDPQALANSNQALQQQIDRLRR